jgi:uncharacterized protein (TIGR03083 family)
MRAHANKEFWLAAMRTDGPAFRAVIAEAEPGMPVPSRTDWTVGALTGHLVRLYTWVASHVSRGVTGPPDPVRPEGPPTAGLTEFDQAYGALLAQLDALDPEMPAWNWAPQAKRVSFWHRRMAHETSLHRWDAQMSLARAEPIETKLAADGVGEVLDTLLPAGKCRCTPDRHGMVALYATDLEHSWHLRLRQGGGVALLDTYTLLDDDDLHERAIAQGTASDLQLALWGRIGFDVLAVSGDGRLLECLQVS